MNINKLKEILHSNPNVSKFLNSQPNFSDEFYIALENLYSSQKLINDSYKFFACQDDLVRYVDIAKKYASYNYENKSGLSGNSFDPNLTYPNKLDMITGDTLNFYQYLDDLTQNKFNLLEKAREFIPTIQFSDDYIRAYVSTYLDGDEFKSKICASTYPIINNRIAVVHEIFHKLDSVTGTKYIFKTYKSKMINPDSLRYDYMHFVNPDMSHDFIYVNKPDYQFDDYVMEIGSLLIDKININFLQNYYKDNEIFCTNLNDVLNDRKGYIYHKAKLSYLDYLFVLSLTGIDDNVQEYAFTQIVNNIGQLWNGQFLLDRFDEYIEMMESETTFIPMIEMRYVVGEAIACEMYNKIKNAQNHIFKYKRDKEIDKILSSIINLNSNLHNIEGLKPAESTADNKIDIITDYLGIDRLEQLLENRLNELLQDESTNS